MAVALESKNPTPLGVGVCQYNFINRKKCCPKCNREKMINNSIVSEEAAIERINKVIENTDLEFVGYTEGEWKGTNNTHLIIRCKKCGCVMDRLKLNALESKPWCRECHKIEQYKEKSEKYKTPIEIVLKNINDMCVKTNHTFIGFKENEYITNKTTHLILKCNRCNKITDNVTYASFLKLGKNCGCDKDEKLIYQIKEICNVKNYEFIDFVNKDENKTTLSNIILKCNDCGTIWNTATLTSLKQGKGCPHCAKKWIYDKMSLDIDERINRILDECNDRNYEFIDFYDKEHITSHSRLILKCNKCGNVWNTTTYNSFVSKHRGCPMCGKSKLEDEIISLLNENKIEFLHNNRKILNGLELDFYIPSKNIAIECQGEQHFKPTKFGSLTENEAKERFKKQVENDLKKIDLCKELNINLIHYSNIDTDFDKYSILSNINELKEILK